MGEVVITGGSGGLGSAIAERLRQENETVHALSSADLDVRDRDAARAWFRGRDVELLVCAAGVTNDALLARTTGTAWTQTWDVCFQGAKNCALAALPGMEQRRAGHVLFLSSHSAIHPPVGQAAYATAKAALLGLTADLAHRVGPFGVRINAVLPGFLETRMTADVSPRRRAEVLDAHSLGRFNTCGAVADFVAFLHTRMPHTSGQVFQLDSRPGAADIG